jgi:hypothetical protein
MESIIIGVRGGHADVIELPLGTKVEILDFDTQGADEKALCHCQEQAHTHRYIVAP